MKNSFLPGGRIGRPCRLLALVCSLALLVSSTALLVGCAGPVGDTSGGEEAQGAAQGQGAENLFSDQSLDSLRYTSESDLTKTITLARCWGVTEKGEIWTYGKLLPDLDKTGDGYAVVWLNESGSVQRSTTFTLPAAPAPPKGGEVRQDVGAVYLGGEDAIFAVVSQETWTEDPYTGEQVVSDLALHLCQPDEDGALQPQTQLDVPKQLAEDVATLELLPGGAFATADGGCWLLLSRQQDNALDCWLAHCAADGSCVQALQLGQNVLQVRPLSASQALFVAGTGNADYTLCTVDGLDTAKATVTRQAFAPLQKEGALFTPCVLTAQQGSVPLLATGEGVWQWDKAADAAQNVLEYAQYGLGDNVPECCFALAEDSLLLVTRQAGEVEYKFQTLNRNVNEQVDGKIVLTLGVMDTVNVDKLSQLIFRFNLENDQYMVRTVDYSLSTAEEKGFSSGTEMLYRDIINNEAPDMMMVPFNLPNQSLLHNGYFIDLYPYLDADPELQRTDFLPNVLAMCEYEGTLPTIVASFMLQTAVGREDVVGPDPGWTWAQFQTVCDANPQLTEVIDNATRESTVVRLLTMGGDKYLDHDAHMCHLEETDFVQLLKTSVFSADTWRAKADAENGAGYVITPDPRPNFSQKTSLLWASWPVMGFRVARNWKYELGTDFVCKGYPNDTGSGQALQPQDWWGITRYCKYPQAAWSFLRLLLGRDYHMKVYQTAAFSARKDVLYASAEAAEQQSFLYLVPGYLDINTMTEEQKAYWMAGVPMEDCEKILTAIESADRLYLRCYPVEDIITEELTEFYNGQRTAEETAKIMQNRVQTYLDEQS